jgi:hypothetical protein
MNVGESYYEPAARDSNANGLVVRNVAITRKRWRVDRGFARRHSNFDRVWCEQ